MRPLRILFSMLHPGYVRNYESTIRLLAERGHAVHVDFVQPDKQAEDRVIEQLATEFPTITFGIAPKREKGDAWRGFVWMVRALADASRYRHPRFAGAPLLRHRVDAKIRKQCTLKGTNRLRAALMLHGLGVLAKISTARRADQATRFLLALEEVAPESSPFLTSISSFDADVVLVTPLVNIASTQTDYLRAARKLGVPAAACIASWDNLTNKGLLRGGPQEVFVWNEVQRREAIEMHGVSPERVIATGAPRFDEWFARRLSTTAAVFADRVGLDAARPFLAYLCSSPFIAPDEVSFVRRWLTGLRSADDPMLRDVGVIVRPHPQNAASWATADISGFENAVVYPRGGAQPVSEDARAVFYDSIAHSAAVVGINTTALLESAIVGKRVLTIRASEFANTQDGTLHYQYLRSENGGFLYEADTLEDHLDQVRAVFQSDSDSPTQGGTFVQDFLRPSGLGVPSTPLIVAEIERLAACRLPVENPSPAILALRMPLGVVAWVAHGRHRRIARRVVVRIARNPAVRPYARKAARHKRLRGLAHRIAATPASLDNSVSAEQRGATAAIRHATETVRLTQSDLVVGPWAGDHASESLVWVPFLRWLSAKYGLGCDRLVAIAPATRADLYSGVCGRVVEASADRTPHITGGMVERLFEGWEDGALPMHFLMERLAFARIPAPRDPFTEEMLPEDYVAVRVAFSPAFPENVKNCDLVRRVVTSLADSDQVVVLGSRLDGIPEPLMVARPDIEVVRAELVALAHARAVLTPLDQDAFNGLFFGIQTIALYSNPNAVADARVDIAERAARELDTPFLPVAADVLPVLSAIAVSARTRYAR
jgi:hypothetical protein